MTPIKHTSWAVQTNVIHQWMKCTYISQNDQGMSFLLSVLAFLIELKEKNASRRLSSTIVELPFVSPKQMSEIVSLHAMLLFEMVKVGSVRSVLHFSLDLPGQWADCGRDNAGEIA